MKRISMLLTLAAVLAGGIFLTVRAEEAKKAAAPVQGQEVTLAGTISCTHCVFANGGKICPEGCCASCIKSGDSVLLTDAEGNQYLLLGKEQRKKLMTPKRMELAGKQVTVKGVLVKGKGLQVIFVEDISKAGK